MNSFTYQRWCAVFVSSAVIGSVPSLSLAGDFSSRVIAMTDDAAPGVAGMEFNTFRPPNQFDIYNAPVINAAGDLAFWANLNPIGRGRNGQRDLLRTQRRHHANGCCG